MYSADFFHNVVYSEIIIPFNDMQMSFDQRDDSHSDQFFMYKFNNDDMPSEDIDSFRCLLNDYLSLTNTYYPSNTVQNAIGESGTIGLQTYNAMFEDAD